jgi:hypothetical protein
MCMYYKNKDDKALSSHKNELFQRYTEMRHRRSLEKVLSISNINSKNNINRNNNKSIGTSNNGINNTDSNSEGSDDKPPFITKKIACNKQATRRRPIAKSTDNINTTNSSKNTNISMNKHNTTSTHQETAMETIDNESMAENDDSSEDNNAMIRKDNHRRHCPRQSY